MGSVLSSEKNVSVYSLPIYYLLTTAPHGFAIWTASGGKLGTWDNRNPRSGDLKTGLRKRLGEAVYAKYERAEAAHYNSLESFPLLAAAVAFGNIADLSIKEMNTFIFWQFLLRVVYQVVYIRTSTQLPTFARTLIWYVQTGWCLKILFKSGSIMM